MHAEPRHLRFGLGWYSGFKPRCSHRVSKKNRASSSSSDARSPSVGPISNRHCDGRLVELRAVIFKPARAQAW